MYVRQILKFSFGLALVLFTAILMLCRL